MAVSGQGSLCASRIGLAVIVCAASPALAQGREERSLEIRVSGGAVYDSNAARSNSVQAAARGLAQAEMEYRPSVNAALVLPVDQHAFFLDADVGYEFHSKNKRLESERIGGRSGVRMRVAGCTAEVSGSYARRLSDLADSYSDAVGNVEEVRGGAGRLSCERPVGFSPVASAAFTQLRNEVVVRRRSDVDNLTLSGGVAYQQPSLGKLSLLGTLTDALYPNRLVGGQRDGVRTYAATMMLERRTGTRVQGSVSAGYVLVDPDLPGVPSFSGMSYGADVVWLPGGRAKMSLSAARSVEASNRLDVSYFRQDMVRMTLRYGATTRLNADIRASYRVRKYAAAPVPGVTPLGTDRSYGAGGGLSFALNRRIMLGLDADYQRRNAAVDLFDYGGTRLGLSASYRM